MNNEFIFEVDGFGNESEFENSSEFFEGEFEDEFEDEYLGEDEDEIRRAVPFRRAVHPAAARRPLYPAAARRPLYPAAARRPLYRAGGSAAKRPFIAGRGFARPGGQRPGLRSRSPHSLQRRPYYGRPSPSRRYPGYGRPFPPYPQPYPQPYPYPVPFPSPEQQPPPPTTSFGTPQAAGAAAPPPTTSPISAGTPQVVGAAAPPPPEESNEQVRLVQSLLNRVLGLNLPVNGILDTATRSAIRSFQGQGGDAGAAAPPAGAEPAGQPPGDEQGGQEEFPYYNDADLRGFRQRRRGGW